MAGIELSLIRLGRRTREEHVARAVVSPDAAPVALAEFEAAAAGVSRQGADEGTQDRVKVVLEEAALALERFGEKQSDVRNSRTRTCAEPYRERCAHLGFGEARLSPQHHAGGSQRCTLPQRVHQVRLLTQRRAHLYRAVQNEHTCLSRRKYPEHGREGIRIETRTRTAAVCAHCSQLRLRYWAVKRMR